MRDLAILIPAAGASRRMRGGDKLLELVKGEPALRHTAALAVQTGARVIVTLPNSGPMLPARRTALTGLGFRPIEIPDYHDGMSASLRAGARAAGPAEGLMVLLPDMPDIEAKDIDLLISAFAADTTRPVRGMTEDGKHGHPVIFPRRLFQEMTVLTGDRGGGIILNGEDVLGIALGGQRALADLDTPEDWDAWRRPARRD
jgi:CTP:molybdopterin cytidylyltransferase MocA